MKIWKNESKFRSGFYYTTNFYDKTMDGEELRRTVNIDFQKGLEPDDNLEGDLYFRTNDGKEYLVLCKAFKKNDGTIEPKFFFWTKEQSEMNRNSNDSIQSFDDEANDDDLPF